MKLRAGLAAAIVGVTLAGAARGAEPEPPPFLGQGTIVFSCSGCPHKRSGPALYTVSASGRGLQKLVTTLSPYQPRWAPSGRVVAFTHRFSRIATLPVPRGRGRLLTNPCSECAIDPAWSPDGGRIAYLNRGRLFTMRADGSRERLVLHRRERGFGSPDWSPDGRRIALHLNASKLAIVRADGTRFRFLRGISGRYPRWSPTGRLIAFIGWAGAGGSALMVARPDGTGRRVVARHPRLAFNVTPAWSPDGRHILFAATYEYDVEADMHGHEFLVASVDGSLVSRLAIDGLPKTTYSEIYGIDWTRRESEHRTRPHGLQHTPRRSTLRADRS